MRTPFERIRLGAVVLAVVFLGSVLGYHLLGFTWIDALWMVVITISSVGYGEHSELSVLGKLYSVGVILFGMSAAFYTIGGLLQMLTEGEIERALGQNRMTREIGRLKNHVIICGFGRIGEILADDLRSTGRPFVVIDNDPERIVQATDHKLLCLSGDASEEETLLQAGVKQAAALVTGLPSDAANVFITLTSRNLNPDLQIIARAEHTSTEKKLRQAGADRVVMPALVGARQMVRMITRPSTADLMELVTESTFSDYELDEIIVGPTSKAVGMTVRDTEAHRRHRLLVVAVQREHGKLLFNPEADYVFAAKDTVLLMGHSNDISSFRTEFNL